MKPSVGLAHWFSRRASRTPQRKALHFEGRTWTYAQMQAEIELSLAPDDYALLSGLGEDLKFVFITSAVTLVAGDALAIASQPSSAPKCERCWHYRPDVGHDSAHPGLCTRCTSNLFGAGERRAHA